MATTARENLFHRALLRVDKHVSALLEERSNVAWASQALYISFFGTIAESANRQEPMRRIVVASGVRVDAATSRSRESQKPVRRHHCVANDGSGEATRPSSRRR